MRKWLLRALAGAAVLVVGLLAVVAADSWVPSGKTPSGARLERMQSAAQWRGDHFVDLMPRYEAGFLVMLKRWLRGAPNTVPETPPPIVERHGADFATPPANGLRVTWFGHSSLLVEIGGEVFLVDPVWGKRCSPLSFAGPERFHPPPLPLEQLPALSAVVISHDHYDHLDYPTILALNERGARFVVPLGVGSHLEYWGVPVERITELQWWGSTPVGKVTLTATPARHFSGRSLLMADKDKTLWAGWAFVGADKRAYYSGDTALFPQLAQIGNRLGPFDVTMIEVGAYNSLWPDVHLGPEQALRAHKMVQGRVLVPVHWGTFNLALHAWTEPMERLLAAAPAQGVTLVTPRPGQSVDPANPPAPERWWPNVPWETAQQSPVVSTGL